MRLLPHIYVALDKIGVVVSQREFRVIFDRATLTDSQFTSQNYSPSGGGVGKLFNDLFEQTVARESELTIES